MLYSQKAIPRCAEQRVINVTIETAKGILL